MDILSLDISRADVLSRIFFPAPFVHNPILDFILQELNEITGNNGESSDSDQSMEEESESEDDSCETSSLESNDTEMDTEDDPALPPQLKCAAHTLNLVGSSDFAKSMKTVPLLADLHERAMKKCQFLWKASRRPKSGEVIREIINASLKYPVVTRWNSLFDSLTCLMKYEEQLNVLLEQVLNLENDKALNNQEITLFTQEELTHLRQVQRILTPISMSLDLLQGEQDCDYGHLLPALSKTLGSLTQLEMEVPGDYRKLVSELVKHFDRRFGEHFRLDNSVGRNAILACCFHPRYRFAYLVNKFPPTELAEIRKICIQELVNIRMSADQVPRLVDSDDEFFSRNLLQVEPTIQEMAEKEFSIYLASDQSRIKNLHMIPFIKKAYIKFNTAMCSSAAVERLFSLGGHILSPRRCSMTDETFRMLTILRANKNIL